MDLENDSIQIEKKTHILLTINGQTDSEIIRFKYFQKLICMNDIKAKIEYHYKMRINNLRLFTQQGVEIFSEDLPYLKEGTLLYVSDGLEFDVYSQISVYTIIKELGEGGFGKVMLGKHKISGEQVAIKVIDSQKLWNAEDIDLMFREADVMKNLRHQNIIKILNCYTLPNLSVVLIMEFLQGGDLVEYLQEKGTLTEEEARVIFRQIAEGIRYCHDKRLIHRDLKLENILLTSKAEKIIKIIDFGIATVSTNFNIDKIDRGSLSYMAPEVISGQAQEIRSSVDIWALGVILYSLVCGTLPFTSKSDEQTIDNILKCNYQLPINPSKEFKDLLSNMLQPDHNQRYSAYQILRHPWMQKVLTSSPTRMLNPRVIGKKAKKGMLKKECTMAGPNRNVQQPQLRCGMTMIKLPNDYKYEESPRSSLNFLDSNRSNNIEQDEIVKSPPPTQRKYSDFNQKLIDRIFQEDSKREKILQFRKHQKQQSQNIRSAATSPINTTPQTRVHSPNLYSVRATSQSSRKTHRQLEIKTIINLSQKFEWKQLFASPTQSTTNIKKSPIKNEKQSEMLYKLQIQFKERKRKSDCLKIIPGQMTIQKLCDVIFSARPKRNNH